MENTIITIILLIILAPVIVVAGFIVLFYILAFIGAVLIVVSVGLMSLTIKMSDIIHNVKLKLKKEGKEKV